MPRRDGLAAPFAKPLMQQAQTAPATSVEFYTPCRSQHAGAGNYFDHALTECETGMRRIPRLVDV